MHKSVCVCVSALQAVQSAVITGVDVAITSHTFAVR